MSGTPNGPRAVAKSEDRSGSAVVLQDMLESG
jgi:hypothetical protein